MINVYYDLCQSFKAGVDEANTLFTFYPDQLNDLLLRQSKNEQRYKWLKENLHNNKMKLPPMIYLSDGDNSSYGEPFPENLDDLIDNAMMERKNEA